MLLMLTSVNALRRMVAIDLFVVRTMPRMLWMLGTLSGVLILTFFVEMKFMISWRVVYRASSGGNSLVRGIVRRQHSRREMKIRYPRWRRVSAFSYSSGQRMVRGPMP